MIKITAADRAQFRSACDDGGTCVEVALMEVIGVRDSKDSDGPILIYTRTEWAEFIAAVKDGMFDL